MGRDVVRFFFHLGTGVFHRDGQARGAHGGQVNDVVADESGLFQFEALLLHDFFEARAFVLNALMDMVEPEIAGAQGDSFRNSSSDQSGLQPSDTRQRRRDAIVGVKSFHFDLAVSRLLRGRSARRSVFGNEKQLAVGEDSVDIEEQQFDFAGAKLRHQSLDNEV